jgi:general secretion pathway protein F
MDFRVRTFAPGDAAARDLVIEAQDIAALRALVQAQGKILLRATPVLVRRRANRQQKGRYALFCREVRTLVRAGMTVVEAVDTLSSRERGTGRQQGLPAALLTKLQQGQALSAAMESMNDAPTVLVAAVRAGERTSNLAEALDDYLRFDELVEGLRRKVISAAIYPALVTALGLGISVFLLLVVLPSFAQMYQNLRGNAGAAGFMISFSTTVSKHKASTWCALALLTAGVGYCESPRLFRRLKSLRGLSHEEVEQVLT